MGISAVAGFIFFLGIFVVIGALAALRRRPTAEDYLVASRSVPPWLAALSAGATANSGFMFMGLVGATFTDGISAAWIMIGWIGGEYGAWFVVHKPLRAQSERVSATTIPSFLAGGEAGYRSVSAVAGLIILVFLSIYASAQFVAGGKALAMVSGWDQLVGISLGAAIVVIYCFAGGIRASIWTDAAQSVVMIVVMFVVYGLAVDKLGGHSAMWQTLAAIDNGPRPSLVEWLPTGFAFGTFGWILGWFGGGMGTVGQPHIMIRAMALDSPDNIPKMRRIYFSWYVVFCALCIGVGLAARALLMGPEFSLEGTGAYDPELGLLNLVEVLQLPGLFMGLTLAGLFAATISTADSQILSCSAALTQDIAPGLSRSYFWVKLGTLLVAGFAFVMAVAGGSVFALVILAWAMLAVGLGPLMVVRALGWRFDARVALITMITGVATSLFWRYGLALHNDLYDVLPGAFAGFAAYFISAKIFLGGFRE